MKIVLALGSNVGDRFNYLQTAIDHIKKSILIDEIIIKQSSIIETKAILPSEAQSSWDIPYLNSLILGHTYINPQDLLVQIKKIEKNIGRKDRGYWGPREIDIDILCYGDMELFENNLVIPHKELLKRDFWLNALKEIYPLWIHPSIKKPILEINLEA